MIIRKIWAVLIVVTMIGSLVIPTGVIAALPTTTSFMNLTFDGLSSTTVPASTTTTTNSSFIVQGTNSPGSYDTTNGYLKLTNPGSANPFDTRMKAYGTGAGSTGFRQAITQPRMVFETRMRATIDTPANLTQASMFFKLGNNTTTAQYVGIQFAQGSSRPIAVANGSGSWSAVQSGSPAANVPFTSGQFYKFKLVVDFSASTNGTYELYMDDVSVKTGSLLAAVRALYDARVGSGFFVDYTKSADFIQFQTANSTAGTMDVDYIKITETSSLAKTATIAPTSVLATVGGTVQCTPTVKDSSSNTIASDSYAATWYSDNTSVATVNATTGLVTGVAIGSANIYTDIDGVIVAKTPVTVSVGVVNVSSVSIPETLSVSSTTFEKSQLTATVLPIDATDKSVTWGSSNVSIATVTATGLVQAVSNGTATITATSVSDNTKTDTCLVTVSSGYMNFSNTNTYATVNTTNAIPFDSSTNGNGLYFNNNITTATASVVTDDGASNNSALKLTSSQQTLGVNTSRFIQKVPSNIGNVVAVDTKVKLVGDTANITARWWFDFGGTSIHEGFSYVTSSGSLNSPSYVAGKMFIGTSDTGYTYNANTWYTIRTVIDNYNSKCNIYVKEGTGDFTLVAENKGIPSLGTNRLNNIYFAYSNPGTDATSGMLIDDIGVYSLNVNSIDVSPTATETSPKYLLVGNTQQFTATPDVSKAVGTPLFDMPIRWETGTSSIATVNSTGLVTAIANGKINISAKIGVGANLVSKDSFVNVFTNNYEMNNMRYLDGTDVATSVIPASGILKVKFDVANNTASSLGNVLIISGLYSAQNELLYVNVTPAILNGYETLSTLENEITLPLTVPTGAYVRTFFWKESNQQPLITPALFPAI